MTKQDSKIVIRSGDLIVAEHEAAPTGVTVTQLERVAALWKLSLKRTKEPIPSWTLTFDQGVAAR